jgi:hypothetical protein
MHYSIDREEGVVRIENRAIFVVPLSTSSRRQDSVAADLPLTSTGTAPR